MLSLSNNSLVVFEKRFLRKNENGELLESPEDLFRRVASAVAKAELHFNNHRQANHWEKQFYRLLSSLDFLPNSPTLMNADTIHGQLSACFVLPVHDSMESIFSALKHAALIQQSGGGTGFNFSELRPTGDFVSKTGGSASGPVSFMKIFDAATHHIKQGGRRRGANMGILNVDHPDILEFIAAKSNPGVLTNFNLSVGISEQFMDSVIEDGIWDLRHPLSRAKISEIKAAEIWVAIIKAAWETGDPGLIFLDEINRTNPIPGIGRMNATNPCGEVPLLPYEACNLGSINLLHMIREGKVGFDVDWIKLASTVKAAIRFLDNVIDVNYFIIPEIRENVIANRKVGLGVMGWAEMLIRLGIPYDTDEAVKLGGKLMQFINYESLKASMELAEERGVFPNWEKSIYYPDVPVRNATRTSIAPTGSISILANTSSSIEPLFALVYERKNILDGETLPEVNSLLLCELAKIDPKIASNPNADAIFKCFHHLPEKIKRLFRTALQISWEYHVKHQAEFQKHVDNAVSKTINLPESATEEDVENAFLMAWRQKAKGITIYRYNSKKTQVLTQSQSATDILSILHDGPAECKVCLE